MDSPLRYLAIAKRRYVNSALKVLKWEEHCVVLEKATFAVEYGHTVEIRRMVRFAPAALHGERKLLASESFQPFLKEENRYPADLWSRFAKEVLQRVDLQH